MKNENTNVIRLPLWKACLEDMRVTTYTFESSWKAEFFEERLHAKRDTAQFQFEMMELRRVIEDEEGYYLRSSENGALWFIPAAAEHEGIAQTFEQKQRRYIIRSIALRSALLVNPEAKLSEQERKKTEKNLERAQLKLLLQSRATSIANAIRKTQPKLLETA